MFDKSWSLVNDLELFLIPSPYNLIFYDKNDWGII